MKKRVLLGGVLFVALCVLAGIGYFGKKMNINFIETETREAPKKEGIQKEPAGSKFVV